MPDRILVLIPCYNCAPQIPRVLAQFDSDAADFVETLLVLDNGSTDGTREAARSAAEKLPGLDIRVALNRGNLNLGGSHKAAFAFALAQGYSHVLVLHGDDQADVQDMLPLLRRGEHRRLDACLGARFAPGSRLPGYSAVRILGNRVFNALFGLLLRHRILDLGSGLNIFGARAMRLPHLAHYADDLRFNIFLLMGMLREKLDIGFFPISWRQDDQVSNVRMTSQAFNMLAILRDRIRMGERFWSADHRAQPRTEYAFDLIHPFSPKAT
ncbi:glycosyltransferase [Xylophilus rhododendri]|uniref:Glycosyltransferase n=1 Tax=Xylophilus rhododendri TaxID=2697032 RepID=A0A857J0H5_9BURK|nr:glycosyltransferase family 2 protein [Xylophilus rhododendri]QHI96773.1 glycosyltransferase [Xylophilus rhododendri]